MAVEGVAHLASNWRTTRTQFHSCLTATLIIKLHTCVYLDFARNKPCLTNLHLVLRNPIHLQADQNQCLTRDARVKTDCSMN